MSSSESFDSMMNRRAACLRFLLGLQAFLLSAVTLAAEEVAKTVSRMAGPRWNVNGNWSPSLEEIQRHLREVHGIDPGSEGMDNLLAMHDNDHNRRGPMSGHTHRKESKRTTKGYAKF